MEIGIAAITLPAAYRQDEIDAGLIGHDGEVQTIRPTRGPAFRHLGGGAARGTIGSEHANLERVRVVHAEAVAHRSITNCHLIVSGSVERASPYTTLKDVRTPDGRSDIVGSGLVDHHRLRMILRRMRSLEHDPEKWKPVFGNDHAPTKS